MPRAWYIYNKSSSGFDPQLLTANYNRAPDGEFDCEPNFSPCAIYVYYSTSTPPLKLPPPLSPNIKSYILRNIATAQNIPLLGKVYAYSGPLN